MCFGPHLTFSWRHQAPRNAQVKAGRCCCQSNDCSNSSCVRSHAHIARSTLQMHDPPVSKGSQPQWSFQHAKIQATQKRNQAVEQSTRIPASKISDSTSEGVPLGRSCHHQLKAWCRFSMGRDPTAYAAKDAHDQGRWDCSCCQLWLCLPSLVTHEPCASVESCWPSGRRSSPTRLGSRYGKLAQSL